MTDSSRKRAKAVSHGEHAAALHQSLPYSAQKKVRIRAVTDENAALKHFEISDGDEVTKHPTYEAAAARIAEVGHRHRDAELTGHIADLESRLAEHAASAPPNPGKRGKAAERHAFEAHQQAHEAGQQQLARAKAALEAHRAGGDAGRAAMRKSLQSAADAFSTRAPGPRSLRAAANALLRTVA